MNRYIESIVSCPFYGKNFGQYEQSLRSMTDLKYRKPYFACILFYECRDPFQEKSCSLLNVNRLLIYNLQISASISCQSTQ